MILADEGEAHERIRLRPQQEMCMVRRMLGGGESRERKSFRKGSFGDEYRIYLVQYGVTIVKIPRMNLAIALIRCRGSCLLSRAVRTRRK